MIGRSVALGAACALLATADPAAAQTTHFDCPNGQDCTIGEYRVTLNHVKIKAFDPGFLGDTNPDVLIKTFVQAETHGGETAIFGVYDDTPVPSQIDVGRLIYWHLDCTPSEKLKVTVDLYDIDGGLGPLVSAILTLGAGIATSSNPEFGPAAGAVADALAKAITEELDGEGRFPQWATGNFEFGDNSGTWTLYFTNGPARDYEVSITFQYIVHDLACNLTNITKLRETIRTNDPEVDRFLDALQDSDGDGVTDQEEKALGSDPNDRNSKPEHRLSFVEQNTCGDLVDNDLDGLTDGEDVGCLISDLDHDGVEDALDNCLKVFNPDQQNSDWDGVGDVCDDDPLNPRPSEGESAFCHIDPPLTLLPPQPGLAGQINNFPAVEATYNAQVAYVYGFQSGNTAIPDCPGMFVSIRNPVLGGVVQADGDGAAVLTRFVPEQARGRQILLQAVEPGCCTVSDVLVVVFH